EFHHASARMDFAAELTRLTLVLERGLDVHLPVATERPSRLHEAMRYSMAAGGKRLRPILVLSTAEAFTSPADAATPAAVAIECLHTYSLIHDDLPCMDNDDLRRGRPTLHIAYDEATALLAGDALLTHAFALLSSAYREDPILSHALTLEMSDAAGSRRLIGGQMEDLLAEKRTDVSAADLEFIHLNKTAAMIEAALVMGGLIGQATNAQLLLLRRTGRNLGLAFQIIDDVLDATADSSTLGKTAGKDAKADKTTFVKLHGLEPSRRLAREHTERAQAELAALGLDTRFLSGLIESMANRIR
ncbi:MAG: polyprenyl synthetase family protein, partial [Opitutus sp.]